MYPDEPQLAISRVLDAPRELAFRAFTDPDHLATWWDPNGNTLPRGEIEFDVRPGGFQRWTEVSAAQPDLRVHIHIDLTDVADGDLLEGRTRLEIRQWLPAHLAGPSNRGWLEALEKLDATLLHIQTAATDAEV
jgi:Activator of Hsp90 ATPase homolog 1-like protein